MACSPEQIAAKRQQALERLKQNKEKAQENKGITSGQFYGSGQTTSKIAAAKTLPTKTDNKIKANPLKDNRIFSQPYPREKPPDNRQQVEEPTAVIPPSEYVVKCALVSEEKFGVTMNKFCPEVTNSFKLIASKNFNPETKLWTFHLRDYKTFLEVMKELRAIKVEELPKFILKVFPPRRTSLDMSFLSSIEPKLAGSLLEFQKRGVKFAIEKEGKLIIADEMGLGKTYQALAIADFYRDDWPVLVCTNASTRDAWVEKIHELLPRIPAHRISILNAALSIPNDVAFVITSYSGMEKSQSKLLEKGFGILILDESHMIKSPKSKCTNTAMHLRKNARRVILLTGTPALSRPSELYTQLKMCDENFFGFKEYTRRYCNGREGKFGWVADGQSNLEELNLLLTQKFMIRRTKEEVMTDMTEKSREVIVLDRNLVKRKENFSDLASNYSQTTGKRKEEILFTFYTETASAKIPAVSSYVKKILKEEKDKKFIIFAYHHVMLEALAQLMENLGVNYIKIDGRTSTEVRNTLVEMFQTKPNYRVAVLSLKACNAGITLTAAQMVIFAELYWNPSTLAQGESRSHRIGQGENVVVRYLLAEGTADDIIWAIIQKKQTILNDAGLGNEDFSDVTQHKEASTSSSTPKITTLFKPATPAPVEKKAAAVDDDDIKKLLEEDDDLDFSTIEDF